MAASPQVVDAAPLFLTGLQNTYDGRHFRKPFNDILGQGVADYDSFRIRQRAAGANMSIDGMTASVLNVAYVRGTGSTDSGMYRVAFNNATQTNVDIATSDPSNPRVDQVFLTVEDSEETGSVNSGKIRIVTGTASAPVTLDNRTGVGSVPAGMSSILLADVLVGAGVTSITNANIRDRRPFGILGAPPPTFSTLDHVTLIPVAQATPGATIQSTSSFDAQQAAALFYLPRRIVGATRMRAHIQQGATANAQNFGWGIYDASGRQLVLTTPQAYGGTANQQVALSVTISAQTLDAGYYWIWHANAAGTASATVTAQAVGPSATTSAAFFSGPNQFAYATAGGTTAPQTIAAMIDYNTITAAAVTARPAVPVITLSVG